MAGGSLAHADIIGNLYSQIRTRLKEQASPCKPMTGEARLYIESYNSAVLPDVAVVCGEREVADHDEQAYTNPVLVIEVVSPSTAGYDRGEKFKKYRSLPTFQEYVLVEQTHAEVNVLHRKSDREWSMIIYRNLDDIVLLNSIELAIPMRAIYEDVVYSR